MRTQRLYGYATTQKRDLSVCGSQPEILPPLLHLCAVVAELETEIVELRVYDYLRSHYSSIIMMRSSEMK